MADGLRKGDSRTWTILLIGAAIAVAVVVAINLFVEKPPPLRFPTGPSAATPVEPKTFDVAPPGSVPAARPAGGK